MEERHVTLIQNNAKLWSQLEKAEAALEEAHRTTREAQEKAAASGQALTEVRSALNFPVDTVNRALLYIENLERDENLNRAQIIRFLLNHSRKMEKTWDKMQELVNNMAPELPKPCEIQVPEDPIAIPIKAKTSGTPSGLSAGTSEVNPGGFVDLIGTPDLVSPMSWSAMSLSSAETLRKWQSVMPKGLS